MDDINELSRYLDASAWAGVGIVGVLLFLLGIYEPALSQLPEGNYVGIGVAILGGALAVMGFSFAYERREYERRHPKRVSPKSRQRNLEIAQSLEIYQPGLPTPPRPALDRGTETDAPSE